MNHIHCSLLSNLILIKRMTLEVIQVKYLKKKLFAMWCMVVFLTL